METFSALLAICAGNSPVPVNSPHKGQWRGALMFSFISVRINGWVNKRKAGDLRRYRAHYGVTVMVMRSVFCSNELDIPSRFSYIKANNKNSSAASKLEVLTVLYHRSTSVIWDNRKLRGDIIASHNTVNFDRNSRFHLTILGLPLQDCIVIFVLHMGSRLLTWIKFNPSMDRYMPSKVWDEITYTFPT